MKLKFILPTVSCVLVLTLASVAWAGPDLHPARIDHIGDRLGLSPDVVRKIKDLAYTNRKSRIKMEAQLKEARLDLAQMMDQAKPDRNAVMTQLDVVAAVELKQRKLSVGLLLDVGALLNAEQHRAFRKLVRARHAKRRGHRGHRKGPHRSPSD
ncbi:MAG: hypothetical protein VX589_12045 [Myxococcota bacterium]|nr:hypothetical protein [Myxococcota bacterium]